MKTSSAGRLMRHLVAAAVAALTLAGALHMPHAHAATLTLSDAQHEQVVNQLLKDFEARTGIRIFGPR